MAIIQAAVGDNLQEFEEGSDLEDVWTFLNLHLAAADVERPIVLRDDSGATIGEIWDSSLFYAHWETPAKMRAYLDMAGFDRPN
jgi:hypothetical protein